MLPPFDSGLQNKRAVLRRRSLQRNTNNVPDTISLSQISKFLTISNMGEQSTNSQVDHRSIPRFLYHQATFIPIKVSGVKFYQQTAIVTGANTGVGFETCSQLLDLGVSKLILAVRDLAKGRAAVAKLLKRRYLPEDYIEVWKLDLPVYESVVAFAERSKTLERIDIVILNAGIAPASFRINSLTGHSECIQVNYLSTALLAVLLLPILKSKREKQKGASRITFVSSEVAGWTSFK